MPPGDVNQLTINAGIRDFPYCFNCSACAEPHSPHHKIHFKKGGHQPAIKPMPPTGTSHSNVVIYNRRRTPTI
ncbi:hypothetical protein D7L69_24570 [Shigella sonnei]|nr:hypothetical protein AM357_22975 [Shigella sonnei]EAA1663378.1 hypothetical protein [Shigella boydii]EFX8951296.1 hypothetical protein [Shigella sonnei]EFX8964714.1 hypothetical protein [Shigella sonnei]